QAVERLLSTSERAHKVADFVVGRAPGSDRTRDLARKLDRQGRRLEFLRRYLDLYREYTQTELRFADDNTMRLYASLPEQDRERFAFDTTVIDWATYIEDIHCPAVTAPLRKLDEARRKRKRNDGALERLQPRGTDQNDAAGSSHNVAAFFDMDGTMLSSNVIETYLWLRLREMSAAERAGHLGRLSARLPGMVRAERHDRTAFLRSVYREYEGARLADLNEIVDAALTDHVLARLAAAAVRRVREHRAAGHRTVLITGAIRPLTRPLAPLFDHIEAADLAVDDTGVCTGFLASSPLTGEARASWMRNWARDNDVDLSASYGYADSHSDLPLLDAVGRPVAVRPDVTLYRHARTNRWRIVDWASPDSIGRPLNPAGSR
ncbi:MAG TPA: HAD-IB family hydrolase, partial [Nocardioidaceae bacterium]|nr:HAD-IB family hydrolase [Nocardioidaceae bacterium]